LARASRTTPGCLFGTVFASDEPRFQNRIYNRAPRDCDEASFLCVPIRLEGEVIGTLSVDLPAQSPETLRGRVRVFEIVASMISYDVHSRQGEAMRRESLEAENLRLRDALQEQFRPENIIGNSHAMREVYVKIQQVAACDITVLIRGESGTGKELVASAIHYSSPRAKRPFIKVNCAALNENLLESEPFGHEKAAFRPSRSACVSVCLIHLDPCVFLASQSLAAHSCPCRGDSVSCASYCRSQGPDY
jgi:Nif-specific regulatory protein